MLKKRVIASLILKDGIAVQSIGFKRYLPIGSIVIAAEFLNKWGVDEIIILDIDATKKNRKPNFDLMSQVSSKIFVPLTVGGGIKSLDDIRRLIHGGADKISINKLAIENPKIINEASNIFGNQCVVVAMDVKNKNGKYEVYMDNGKNPTGINPLTWAKKIEKLGAGEILVNSIDNDGSKLGYDLKIIKKISDGVNIPVIALGGAGRPSHFLEAFTKGNVLAVAASNFFHFTEHSPIIVKSYLRKHGIDVRLDTYADYQNFNFDKKSQRIIKRPEDYLDKLRFEYISEEVI